MTEKNITNITYTLDDLLKSRYQGASNIAGIRFQLLYSVLRAFDLYADLSANEVHFEGLEDVDVAGTKEKELKAFSIGDTYIQVKRTGSPKTLGWLDQEKVLDHFIEVYLKHPDARFLVVTSLPVKSTLEDVVRYCHGQLAGLPPSANQKVRAIATRAHLNIADISTFLHRITFECINEKELLNRLQTTIIRYFDLNAGNELLYLSYLVGCATSWAANRTVLRKQDMDLERLHIQEWIGLGVENPAVRDRLIQPLNLVEEETIDDYYEGNQARLGHILAGLDAPRPDWQQAIEKVLKRVHVCIIRASSGQGKSTLLYRYAADHFAPDTIYRLQTCTSEEQVGPLVDYLRNRLLLGVPLLVLVDNLDYRMRFWSQAATALAGSSVYFLVATREEDWYRYGLGANNFLKEFVEPQLSSQEAKAIFNDFDRQGKIARNVPSSGWAYEQVAERKLLIEFVYLITHGHMLADRIEEQIATIEERGEDPAKLKVLRLISTAQMYGARVRIASLLQYVDFQRDPDHSLKTLEREYILYKDGECEGLHFVRSEHLVRALHTVVPVQNTVIQLFEILDPINLAAFVASIFADNNLKRDEILSPLIERCQRASLSLNHEIVEALFLANEAVYVETNKKNFDMVVEQIGAWALPLLVFLTLPSGEVESFKSLIQQQPGRPALQLLSKIAQQFNSREDAGLQRIPRVFLEKVLSTFLWEENESLGDLGLLCSWCHFFSASAPVLDEFLLEEHWKTSLFQNDGESASLFLHALYQHLPDRYSQFVAIHRESLVQRFKLESRTLRVEEAGSNIELTFIVDERSGAETPNDQAVGRLQLLRCWFPVYEHYCSQGLYPSMNGQMPEVDDSHKDMTAGTLDLSILHAPKNKLYKQLVEEKYAAALAYDWEKPWDILRRTALRFAHNIITQYEIRYRGRSFDGRQIARLALELETVQKKVLSLPNRLKDVFSSQQKTMDNWSTFLLNFSHQFLQHDPHDPKQQDSRLMRRNLKDVVKRLPTFHQAFVDLFEFEPDHYSMSTLNEQEKGAYVYLSDLLDYWFEHPQSRIHHLESVVKKWKEDQRQTFAKKVRESLIPLAQQGMEFLYPVGSSHDHPLIGLYLGYKVMDFTRQMEQLILIVNAIASLDVDYHFLYLIPTVQIQQFGVTATRIAQQTVKQIAAGDLIVKEVYPVLLPNDIHTVLPDLDTTPLADVALVLECVGLLKSFLAEQSKLAFSHLLLNIQIGEEAQLFSHYEKEVKNRIQLLLDMWIKLQEKAHNEDNGMAQQEWERFWEQAAAKVEHFVHLGYVNTREIQQLIDDLSSFDLLFARYMNRKYLRIKS